MNISTTHKFIVGSNAFFNEFLDFDGGHDIDELYIIDYPMFGNNIGQLKVDNHDKFFLYDSGKENIINNTHDAFEACKFIIPEFAKYIKLTIDDLKEIGNWYELLDDKHKYVKFIYESYIKNNDFVLTEEQLNEAYKIYKKYR